MPIITTRVGAFVDHRALSWVTDEAFRFGSGGSPTQLAKDQAEFYGGWITALVVDRKRYNELLATAKYGGP